MNGISITGIYKELVPEVARLHCSVFPENLNTRLGAAYVNNFLGWFSQNESGIALCALDDRRVVGYVVGAPLGYERSLNRSLLSITAISLIRRPWLVLDPHFTRRIYQKVRSLVGRVESHSENEALEAPVMYLLEIAVASSARGKKVGQQLMQTFEERAIQQQMKSLMLSVHRDNLAARRLYEKMGWCAVSFIQDQVGMYYYKSIDGRASNER